MDGPTGLRSKIILAHGRMAVTIDGSPSGSLPSLFIFRQGFNQVIEAEPKTPTVVKEGDREEKRQDEECR